MRQPLCSTTLYRERVTPSPLYEVWLIPDAPKEASVMNFFLDMMPPIVRVKEMPREFANNRGIIIPLDTPK